MKETDVRKVKDVWNRKNNISNPSLDKNILKLVSQLSSLFSSGESYYFVFSFATLEMQFVSDEIKNVLGIEPNTFNLDYLFSKFHPEDIAKIHEKEEVCFDFLMNHISPNEIPLYKVIYMLRIQHTDGTYKTMLHQSRAINVTDDGKIQQILCVQTDLTYLNVPMDHRASFISTERPSYYAVETTGKYEFHENNFFKLFTNKEKEILKELANGNTFINIAKSFQVSPHTINTHKRNILKKSHCKNTAELITKCIREGVI